MNDRELLELLTLRRIKLSRGVIRRLAALISVQGRMKKLSREYRRSLRPKTTHIPSHSFELAEKMLQKDFDSKFKELAHYLREGE